MWEESFRITTKEEITLFRGKKYKDSAKLVDRSTQYEVPAAMDLVVKTASAKFDETVEVHIKLGVDSRHADQQVRGAIVLPNGTGKTRKVLVFAKDAKLDEAKEAGADFAGGMELVEKIQKENWFDFDVVVATPDMMGIVGRLGKVLGPKGLMPSPKAGTVTPNVTAAVTGSSSRSSRSLLATADWERPSFSAACCWLRSYRRISDAMAAASSMKSRSRRCKFSISASSAASSSPTWATRQGTCRSPAMRAARSRRSPATSSYTPPLSRTVSGCKMP